MKRKVVPRTSWPLRRQGSDEHGEHDRCSKVGSMEQEMGLECDGEGVVRRGIDGGVTSKASSDNTTNLYAKSLMGDGWTRLRTWRLRALCQRFLDGGGHLYNGDVGGGKRR
jgi:hypothetical protein